MNRSAHPLSADAADLNKMMVLLQEYAGKLRAICEDYASARARSVQTIFLGVISTLLFGLVLYVLFTISPKTSILRDFISEETAPLLIVLLMAFPLLPLALSILRDRQQRTFDVHQVATTVEKLIRTASQYGDHSINRIGDKFEFDIRLAEAEASLRLYQEVFQRDLASNAL